MKVFKRIYYPVMAALLCLMLVLGFVDSTVGSNKNKLGAGFITNVEAHLAEIAKTSHNSYNETAHENVRNYIVGQLQSAGIPEATEDTSAENEVIYVYDTKDGKPGITYAVQDTVMNEETMQEVTEMQEKLDKGEVFIEVGKKVNNIVVYIPGNKTKDGYTSSNTVATGDVIMVMAHYDSRREGPGASDNSVAVSAMLENIKYIVRENLTFDNDLLFLFSDAEEEGMYGAFTFKHQFAGFDSIYDRVQLGTNFDALGSRGSMVMFQSSDNNYKLINKYSQINGTAFTSSIANFVYNNMSNYTDYNIFGDKTSLNFANVGGRENYHTSRDTVENASKSIMIQHANMMHNVYDSFGNYDLSKLTDTKDAVYFSYLDLFTVVYPYVVSFIMGILIIGLIAAIIFFNIKKKAFSFGKMGGGIAVQLLSIIATVIVLFIAYYLITLLLAGFGVIPIRAIGKITFSSVGLIVSVMLLTAVISSAFILFFKRVFNVSAADIVRGNVFIWAAIALVLAFAAPHLSYFFVITAILELVVLLLFTLLGKKFKDKTGMPFGRLYPYLLPFIFTLPMIVPVIMIASMVLNLTMLPVIMALFMLISGFITPYFGLTKGFMDKLTAKLPKRTIRVEKEYVERIEDKAKKGKFTEQKVKRIEKEKVDRKYYNAFGISVLSVAFSVMIFFFSCFGVTAGKNLINTFNIRDSIYTSSIVYVWERNSDNIEYFVEVKDLLAYKYARDAIGGLKWDNNKEAYSKNADNVQLISSGPTISKTGSSYTVSPFDTTRSQTRMEITGASSISKINITRNSDNSTYEYENDGQSNIFLNFPYGFGSYTMLITGSNSISFKYTEYNFDDNLMLNVPEWNTFQSYYSNNDTVLEHIKSGVVLRYNATM